MQLWVAARALQNSLLFSAHFLRIFYICARFTYDVGGYTPCPGGEIGRHARLRGVCFNRRAGSNPVPGTSERLVLTLSVQAFLLCIMSYRSAGVRFGALSQNLLFIGMHRLNFSYKFG